MAPDPEPHHFLTVTVSAATTTITTITTATTNTTLTPPTTPTTQPTKTCWCQAPWTAPAPVVALGHATLARARPNQSPLVDAELAMQKQLHLNIHLIMIKHDFPVSCCGASSQFGSRGRRGSGERRAGGSGARCASPRLAAERAAAAAAAACSEVRLRQSRREAAWRRLCTSSDSRLWCTRCTQILGHPASRTGPCKLRRS